MLSVLQVSLVGAATYSVSIRISTTAIWENIMSHGEGPVLVTVGQLLSTIQLDFDHQERYP